MLAAPLIDIVFGDLGLRPARGYGYFHTRREATQASLERRFFISSLPVDPKKALKTAVQHWDVENPLHWTLDMVFDEDHSRARSEYAAENLAIMRHFAFNMIRMDEVTRGGIKRKKKTMTWNADKLLRALMAA